MCGKQLIVACNRGITYNFMNLVTLKVTDAVIPNPKTHSVRESFTNSLARDAAFLEVYTRCEESCRISLCTAKALPLRVHSQLMSVGHFDF